MAATRLDAQQAFDTFLETYRAKYPKAVECLQKDRERALGVLRLPGRTLDPLTHDQSDREHVAHRPPAAPQNQRQRHPQGCLSMVYKLMESAAKRWRLLNGSNYLPDVIAGVQFTDGIKRQVAAA